MTDEQDYKYDLFISYNRADEVWAGRLAARLEQEDYRGRKLKVFFAPWDIPPGEYITESLEEALPQSRKVGLVITPEAMQSEWVKIERLVTVPPAHRTPRSTGDVVIPLSAAPPKSFPRCCAASGHQLEETRRSSRATGILASSEANPSGGYAAKLRRAMPPTLSSAPARHRLRLPARPQGRDIARV